MARMTMAEKEYLTKRAGEAFGPIIAQLNDQLIPVRKRIREQVEKEMGVSKVQKQMDKMIEALIQLNNEYREVAGHWYPGVDRVRLSTQYAGKTPAGNPVEREVEMRLRTSKHSKNLNAAKEQMRGVKDKVMLAGFPTELAHLFEVELPKMLEPLQRRAGLLNGNTG